VTDAAMAALAATDDARPALSGAVARLATAWPVYRSYAADLAPLTALVKDAVKDMEAPAGALLGLLHAPHDRLARAFAARFEQLTGALTAKSEEDTVFFRSVAFLPFCEVGSEPDLEAIDAAGFAAILSARAVQSPLALDALSTHDTKRSADARAVIVALSHFPEVAEALYRDAREQARAARLPERWGVYALQTALMLRGQDEAQERIAAHIAKAMREAKELSRHEAPDEEAEGAVTALALSLHRQISGEIAPGFDAAVETIILAQVALQLTAPGIPDIYQGTEGLAVALTDPDNRRPVPWDGLPDTGGKKLALTRELLARRRTAPDLFARGSYRLTDRGDSLLVEREWEGERFAFEIPLVACPALTARPDDRLMLQ
jgi:(1->4)-alpha-D-glucan 1-alpha-D-glucosylmutase